MTADRVFSAISRRNLLAMPFLVLLGLIAWLPGFFTIPPSDRDESRFAQASKQMLESGDYIDIRFQDEPRHKKPAGIYWLQAASAAQFGGAEAPIWAYRIPSLVGAMFAVLLTFWAAIPALGRRGALLAATMMASCVLLAVESRIAKTDAMLLFCATAALGALLRFRLREAQGLRAPAVFWTALAGGVLLKGPVILAPVLGAVLWIAAATREIGWLKRSRPLPGMLWMLALCMPWFWAIMERSEGAFLGASVGEDLGRKLLSGVEAHGGPPGAHFGAFLGTFWPWTILALFALPWIRAHRREGATALLIGWIVPFWLVLELTPTKLPHYPLPAFPAIAILASAAFLALVESGSKPQGWRFALPAALWALPALALPLAAIGAPLAIEGGVPGVALIAAPLAFGTAFLAWRALRGWLLWRFVAGATTSAVLSFVAVFGGAIPALETGFIAPRLAASGAACGVAAPVALSGFTEPSAVFLLGTETRFARTDEVPTLLADGYAVWVTDRAAETAFAGKAPEPQARITGFNYNGGDRLSLGLYAAEPLACPLTRQ